MFQRIMAKTIKHKGKISNFMEAKLLGWVSRNEGVGLGTGMEEGSRTSKFNGSGPGG